MTSSADLAVTVPPLIAAAAGARSTGVLGGFYSHAEGHRRRDPRRLGTGLSGVEVVPQGDRQERIQADAEPLGVGVGLGLEIVGESGCSGHWWQSGVEVTPLCHHALLSALLCFIWDKALACGSLRPGGVPPPACVPQPGSGPTGPRGRRASLTAARSALSAQTRPWDVADGVTVTPSGGAARMHWLEYEREAFMARRQRIRQAIDRARRKHPGTPASLPLGGKDDTRSGTPPSAPVAEGQLSGATAPAPAWKPSPRTVFLLAALKSRWGWFIEPRPVGLSWMGSQLWNLRLDTGFLGLRIRLRLYYAKLSLIMWITGQDTHFDLYTLSII